MNSFLCWELIGKGAERQCFLFPDDKKRCLKVSLISKSKQSKREIKYLSYLKKKNIPFNNIPVFYGVFKSETHIGIEQEIIRDSNGSISNNLAEHIRIYCRENKENQNKLLSALDELYFFMLSYNVVPCDLVLSNILIQVEGVSWRAYIIDGLGTTEFIPLTNYVNFLSQMKIKRKWNIFISRIKPLILA